MLHRELLEPARLLTYFQSFWAFALIVYLLASLVRWLTLLPSTPLVLVGVLFFPESPILVFLISMIGIVFSAIIIYRFSDLMGFDEYFAKHVENKKIHKLIEKYGFIVIAFWSFFPAVPTDLICYVAGTVRYNFWKFVIALSIGEAITVTALIWWWWELLSLVP
jgi:uncharacterized membrane protein YdjX (TVP38/TMEM64 family)